MKGKEGILVNCTSTGHWKETKRKPRAAGARFWFLSVKKNKIFALENPLY